MPIGRSSEKFAPAVNDSRNIRIFRARTNAALAAGNAAAFGPRLERLVPHSPVQPGQLGWSLGPVYLLLVEPHQQFAHKRKPTDGVLCRITSGFQGFELDKPFPKNLRHRLTNEPFRVEIHHDSVLLLPPERFGHTPNRSSTIAIFDKRPESFGRC
jgi:hypothetical protein